MSVKKPPTFCELCGMPKPRQNRFCSSRCSDTARQQHGGTMPPKPAVLLLALPVELPIELPPALSAEELTRAAVFVLTGKIRDVTKALLALQTTPWPTDDEA